MISKIKTITFIPLVATIHSPPPTKLKCLYTYMIPEVLKEYVQRKA
jgi:hypothetical protein